MELLYDNDLQHVCFVSNLFFGIGISVSADFCIRPTERKLFLV